ncbi:MAG: hypothetical protein PWP23_1374 [Candidatus Sumerlaeota bacterium]|nr:hypothetical protein [Candidatus Sumerlaeota bacterium]
MLLLPEPKKQSQDKGVFTFREGMRLLLPPGMERPEWLAAQKLRDAIAGRAMVHAEMDRRGLADERFPGAIALAVANPPEPDARKAQGYRIVITRDCIDVTGHSAVGLLNALRTLIQLVREHGTAGLPCGTIEDEPDFRWRGFYHDISRGKVPKLHTYKFLVRELARLKGNMFQLYVEHPFAFRFDPDIAHGPDALTPEEVLLLQEHCRDRRVELVPSLQLFGHMGGVLSLPQYRHLADVETKGTWEEMTWSDRLKGATIDMSSADARALIEKMADAFFPLFDSSYVNVCADETYDLGRGKTATRAEKEGRGRLYLEHIRFLHDVCARHGKRMMIWGDILKGTPEIVSELPPDTILLNWGYDAETDYESCELFGKSGLEFFGCPGTSGWARLLNALDNADLNIRRYAAAARKYGATGLLNTDWGDNGHYNLLAGSMHGLTLGAAMGWNVDAPNREEFDRRWCARFFKDQQGHVARALRALSFAADRDMTWSQMAASFTDRKQYENLPPMQARKLAEAAREAHNVLQGLLNHEHGDLELKLELMHGVRMNELLAEKVMLVHELDQPAEDHAELADRLRAFARKVERLLPEYEHLWLARNKRSDLDRILETLNDLCAEARQLADGLENEGAGPENEGTSRST